MTTYRTGNHHGVTIVAENDGARCGREGHDCTRGHLAAVVVDGGVELAERICALLNTQQALADRYGAAPSGPPSSPEQPPVGGSGRPERAQTLSGGCPRHDDEYRIELSTDGIARCNTCGTEITIDAGQSLTELNQRADEHTEVCQ